VLNANEHRFGIPGKEGIILFSIDENLIRPGQTNCIGHGYNF
jgi:hypothetical protein